MVATYLKPGQADLPSKQYTHSYWHQEPSKKLLGYQSSQTLPAVADVVIIGSGITGAFAARTAKETWARDLNVVMLEAREVCWGATGRNGGHCQPNIYASAPHIAEFEIRTFTYLKNLVDEHAIPCHWKSVTGCHSFYSQNLVDRAAANLEYIARVDPKLADAARLVTPTDAQMLPRKDEQISLERSLLDRTLPEKLSLEKLRVSRACGAVAQVHAASLWPYKLVCWVIEDLLTRFGGEDATTATRRTRAEAATPQSSSSSSSPWPLRSFSLYTTTAVDYLQRFGEIWIVHTERGQLAAKQVLVATNGHTSRILPGLTRAIVPVRGQVAALVPRAKTAVAGLELGLEVKKKLDKKLNTSHVFLAEPGEREARSETKRATMDDYLVQVGGAEQKGVEFILGGARALGEGKGVGVSADDEIDKVVSEHLKGVLPDVLDLDDDEGGKGEGRDGEEKGETSWCCSPSCSPPSRHDCRQKIQFTATYEWTGTMGFSVDGHPWVGRVPASAATNANAGTDTDTDTEEDAEGDTNAADRDVDTGANTDADTDMATDPDAGLWVCAGYTGHGMAAAALAAKAVVEMMGGAREEERQREQWERLMARKQKREGGEKTAMLRVED
ncbi:bifunctional tRNA (mnm(5)s(2)U34)-methyltransferase/FAD-dependent cmnm(5)s(2)U34 oxidoreductase [Ceratocystis platani]|uniref:Bifunctional tRNA (Mnm(5)s(2)U34)-methyltransferase/FAD-dependent cmnm(5)s(2)U34 oxidoreductase n=1 Tax=Ceratocystis fimbriata f. sp. platani TaxID=88771 RepID=A0A0F8B3F9_CERFI|nr:bifunctional tRNA (mnm(5)s(2)U34)-methyltransferase/FAD-dependent cmnm(5)s(2)U34 oxidoreductase [Ceratocystis platani]